MPVEDHPVHERTKIGDDFRYGCFNRVIKAGYWASTWGTPTFVTNRMSRDCRYDFKETDPACTGCKWRLESGSD